MKPLAGLVLVVFASAALAQPKPKPFTSDAGKFTAAFPAAPRESAKTADLAVGEVTYTTFTHAASDGNTLMVSYADYPAAATKPDNLKTLFDGLRDGAKRPDGKLSGEEKTLEVGPDKLPGREFLIEKGKQRVRIRAVVSGARVYLVAAIGPEAFATGKDATAFLDSFTVTK
jgi:hypothetical protein